MKYDCHVRYLREGRDPDPEDRCAVGAPLTRLIFEWWVDDDTPPPNVMIAQSNRIRYETGLTERRAMLYACPNHLTLVGEFAGGHWKAGTPILRDLVERCPTCRGVGDGQDLDIPDQPIRGTGPDGVEFQVWECPVCDGRGSLPPSIIEMIGLLNRVKDA